MAVENSIGAFGKTDKYGYPLLSGASAINEVEILDLLCEGPIEGLVEGEYTYSGIAGEIGYRMATYKPYDDAPNTNIKFLRSIYWNDVPVVNSENRFNYQRVDVSFTPGLPNGSDIGQRNDELTVSRSINERLLGPSPGTDAVLDESAQQKTYRIINPYCKGCYVFIKVNTLSYVNSSDGQSYPSRVDYKIYYRPIYNELHRQPSDFVLGAVDYIEGNINYGFLNKTRVDFTLPDNQFTANLIGWEIKIIRLTPESISALVRNQTIITAISEIYSKRFLYPNCAMVRAKFNAEYFSEVPTRAYDVRMRKVKVPSNYDPVTRTYLEGDAGWDGTFAETEQWTNNPAWCFYDLITNSRYGLAKYLPSVTVDKWSIYQIAKECDRLVPSSNGGLEPQFACNVYINSFEDAFKVINDMASVFRGLAYYANGVVFPSQDSPRNPIAIFTNDNVVNGDFTYSSTAKRARHTVAIVRYNDETNLYRPAIELVEDYDGIRKYGIRELDLVAFGCSSRSQAVRLGRWALLTENLETETISFSSGPEAAYLRPGDVFYVYDAHRKVSNYGGRVLSADLFPCDNSALYSGSLVLDRKISVETGNVYQISIMSPAAFLTHDADGLNSADYSLIRGGLIQTIAFTGIQATGSINNNYTIVNIPYPAFNEEKFNISKTPSSAVWCVAPSGGVNDDSQLMLYADAYYDSYRVISVSEEENFTYKVVGLQYNPQKYVEIASGITYDRPLGVVGVQPNAPSNVIAYVNELQSATPVIKYSFTVSDYKGLTHHKVYIKNGSFGSTARPDDTFLVATLPYNISHGEYLPGTDGTYYIRVYGFNSETYKYSDSYVETSISITNAANVTNLEIYGLRMTGDLTSNAAGSGYYATGNTLRPTFLWDVRALSTAVAATNFNFAVSIRPPASLSSPNIPNNTVYALYANVPFDASSPSFTLDLENNTTLLKNVKRSYDVVVEAYNNIYVTSAGNRLNFNSTPPSYLTQEAWTSYPKGYDILHVYNPPPSGFYLSTGSTMTEISGYITKQWVNQHNQLECVFISGSLSDDIVGGLVYYSTGRLYGKEAVTGSPFGYKVYTGAATFDAATRTLIGYPSRTMLNDAEFSLRFARSGFVALTLFDAYDDKLIKSFNTATEYNNYIRGLYVSNSAEVSADGVINELSIADSIRLYGGDNTNLNNRLFIVPSGGGWVFKTVDASGNEVIIASKL